MHATNDETGRGPGIGRRRRHRIANRGLTALTDKGPGAGGARARAGAGRGALIAGALLAAACGSGPGGSEPEAAGAAAASSTAAPAPTTTRPAATTSRPAAEATAATDPPTTETTEPAPPATDAAETDLPTTETTDAAAEIDPAAAQTTEPAPDSAEAPAETDPPPAPAAGAWERVTPDDCVCADGSPYSFWVREADPRRVVFHLMAGGACFNIETCSFDGVVYTASASAEPPGASGIFDPADPANPVAGHSFVVVTYCTGDLHLGTTTTTYGGDLTVSHTGFLNASKALDELANRFDDPVEVVVTGSSAGSAAAPLFGGLVADRHPEARVAVVADSSGAYPDNPAVNAVIGGLWGVDEALPDWPVNQGLTIADIGLPGLFVQTGLHHPGLRFSRFDHALDPIQAFFTALSGSGIGLTDRLIRDNEALIEGRGVPVAGYLAPGFGHTILGQSEMYTLKVEGTAFIDWLTAFLAGEAVDDVG